MKGATVPASSTAPRTVASAPTSSYQRYLKRPLDVLGASVALVVLVPVIALISSAILLGLGRPVFYSQRRVGLGGDAFTIFKFRTMRPDRRQADAEVSGVDRRRTHKHENDPRHTGFGRLLRRTSLDELPQLWNVIRGDMSLVGPRPELVSVAESEGFVDHERHAVRPGITGAFQTSALRSAGDLSQGLHLDAEYVDDITFLGDCRILLATVEVLLTGSSRGS